MVWILFIIGVLLLVIGYIVNYQDTYGEDSVFTYIGGFVTIICVIVLCSLYGTYYYNKYTLDSQIGVLEQQNEVVLSQIEPIVNNALTFESETYKELKLSPERIIAIGQIYPDLKNNTFLQTQMEIVIRNQQIITKLKLTKARLKATGKIVEVEWRYLTNLNGFNSIRYVDQKTGISYFEGDLDFNIDGKFAENCLNGIKQGNDYTPDYWTRFEHQAAIAAMQGILSNAELINLRQKAEINSTANVTKVATKYAHALVEKLKKEEK